MPWGADKRLMELADLAHAKGYSFVKAIMRDHVRLTDPEGRRVVKDTGSSAFGYTEARRFLDAAGSEALIPGQCESRPSVAIIGGGPRGRLQERASQ